MIRGIKPKYCPICDEDTDHQQGCFKCKEINGELFHFDVSLSDSLQKVGAGYKDYVIGENNGVMDADSPTHYSTSKQGGLDFGDLFAPNVRSLKCVDCGHLLKISRFP